MLNPYCIYLLGADSKIDKQRRLRLAHILKSKGGASAKEVGGSPLPTSDAPPSSPNPRPQHNPTPSTPPAQLSPDQPPNSPPPIAAIPLALVEAAAPSAPLDKGKRVVVVPSDDDEDSAEGQVFKQHRTTQRAPQTATSATSSSHGADSLREDPPSASSPPRSGALEGRADVDPEPTHPEFPSPIWDSLRGYLERESSRGQHEERRHLLLPGCLHVLCPHLACVGQSQRRRSLRLPNVGERSHLPERGEGEVGHSLGASRRCLQGLSEGGAEGEGGG